eukprot:TRINITY_DN7830_c5_g1_i1.p3 TRINITY_DN7830_c5_g1~~TRINITY_DN7830_c5_g1_i1.p3  ORF type:complete len:122 (-),score=4.45 TRINITY_DN7830_c5_g1_i1:103-468(-)
MDEPHTHTQNEKERRNGSQDTETHTHTLTHTKQKKQQPTKNTHNNNKKEHTTTVRCCRNDLPQPPRRPHAPTPLHSLLFRTCLFSYFFFLGMNPHVFSARQGRRAGGGKGGRARREVEAGD